MHWIRSILPKRRHSLQRLYALKKIKGLFLTGLFCMLSLSAIGADKKMSAAEIYQKSVNIFTHPSMQYIVDSTVEYDGKVSEARAFKMVTQKQDEDNSAVLLRFIAPADLKCTAILINKEQGDSNRYVYFPSLKRVRVVPESDKQKEIMGMGISFEEMTKPQGQFEPVLTNYVKGKQVYQLTLLDKNKKTVFLIEPDNLQLIQIEVFEKQKLIKRVNVFEVKEVFDEKVITAWQIHDFNKKRIINYQVRDASISNQIKKSEFYKNRLKRCNL